MNIAEARKFMQTRLFEEDVADAVTYNGVAILAHVEWQEDNAPGTKKAAARLHVRTADVPAPASRDEVVIMGKTWHVVSEMPVAETKFGFVLEIEADVRPTFRR